MADFPEPKREKTPPKRITGRGQPGGPHTPGAKAKLRQETGAAATEAEARRARQSTDSNNE